MNLHPASPTLAARMGDIATFHVLEILARARQLEAEGRSIIHMGIGEPDFGTPPAVIAAAHRALDEKSMHYAPAFGLPELRSAIAGFYRSRYGVAIDPSRIIITSGSTGALVLALGALVGAGQRLLLTDPGYPANRHFVRVLEGVPVGVPVDAQSQYQLSASSIAEYWDEDTVGALIATPSNPTGTMISHEALIAIHEAVAKRKGTLIVDEIYHGLTYGRDPRTALEISDDIVVLNSFSKYFGMTGWRVGWVVAPPSLIEPIGRLAQNLYLAVSTPAQYAALASFSEENIAVLEVRRQTMRDRRDFLVEELRRLGFRIPVVPEGAFYIYADCSSLCADSMVLCRRLLEEAGVAITPGIDFGVHRAQEHVRFAYTTELDKLREGTARIERLLASSRSLRA